MEYTGNLSISILGEPCIPWSIFETYRRDNLDADDVDDGFHPEFLSTPNLGNHCR